MTALIVSKTNTESFFMAADKAAGMKRWNEENAGMMVQDEPLVIMSADHLAETKELTGEWFVTTYNDRMSEDKLIKKFADRATAAKRTWKLLVEEFEADANAVAPVAPKAEPKDEPTTDEPTKVIPLKGKTKVVKAKKAKKEKAPKEPKEKKPSPRDRPMFADDIPTPYRKNTQSYDTWMMLVKHPGKTFHELSEMKARENTLADAIKRGFIVFEDPSAQVEVAE